MKNLCEYFNGKIFEHDWEYKTQIDLFVPPKVIVTNTMFGTGYYSGKTDSNGNPLPIEISKEVRICKRCKKKEQKSEGFDKYNFKKTYSWLEDKLTKEEERDIKLEKLLK